MRSLTNDQNKWKGSQVEQWNVACVFAFKMRKRYGQIICREHHMNPSGGDITVRKGVQEYLWSKCVLNSSCVPLWLLILIGLIHFHTVIASEIQITKEHTGLIQLAFISANDFQTPPVPPCVSLPHSLSRHLSEITPPLLKVNLLCSSDCLYYKGVSPISCAV